MALAEHLVKATCLPGDEIVYSWRSFEAYPIIAAGAGATSVRVPNTAGHGHDLPAMAAAITDRTRLVLVCNPNNPTGTAVRKAELDRFLDDVPSDVLVVLDEAYREFVTDDEVPDALDDLRRPRRTWWCCARCPRRGAWPGCGSASWSPSPRWPPRSARWSRRSPPAWSPRPRRSPRWTPRTRSRRRCAIVVAERERVTEALRKLSVDVPASQANFVWLPLGDRAAEFGAACESRGVIVRAFQPDGVRVTIGTPEENDAFLAAAEAALN